jgi:hypothetical protein
MQWLIAMELRISVSILTPDTVTHYVSDVGGSKMTALTI